MKTIQVLLVDDHIIFRKGLAGLLEKEDGFVVVGEAQDGIEAIEKAQHLKPDVVLMDISMPRMDGIAATQRIREAIPSTKIIMLTILDQDEKLFDAVKAGAHGYLTKNLNPCKLFKILRGVVQGEAALSRVMSYKILKEFTDQARNDHKDADNEQLSAREMDVLQLLAKGFKNKEIGNSLNITENTVKNHMRHILEKLHLTNRVQAATYAHEMGIATDEKITRKD